MKNLAVIPARSGSKGLKDKNIKNICGRPLLYYSVVAAKKSGMFSEIMVSTDSRSYADVAIACGASVPFLRSDENSRDTSGSWDVVREVLENYIKMGLQFETVCLLQPTSPLRTAEDIVNGYKLMNDRKADAVTAVCEVEHSPLWTMILPGDHSLMEYRKKQVDLPRQQLDTYYRVNGALYIKKIKYFSNHVQLCGIKEYALIMKRNRSIDIDEQLDFDIAEYFLVNSGEHFSGSGDYNRPE